MFLTTAIISSVFFAEFYKFMYSNDYDLYLLLTTVMIITYLKYKTNIDMFGFTTVTGYIYYNIIYSVLNDFNVVSHMQVVIFTIFVDKLLDNRDTVLFVDEDNNRLIEFNYFTEYVRFVVSFMLNELFLFFVSSMWYTLLLYRIGIFMIYVLVLYTRYELNDIVFVKIFALLMTCIFSICFMMC